MPIKFCPHHRAQGNAHYKSPKGQKTRAAYHQTETYRQSIVDRNDSAIYKQNQMRHNRTDRRKDAKKTMYQNCMNDPGRKMMVRIGQKLNKMLRKSGVDSKTVSTRTQFKSAGHLREHMESTFVAGMNWQNHGNGDNMWNIGHKIARSMYDGSNEEDMRRCWSTINIFAQFWRPNVTLGVTLPPDAELLKLQSVWPTAWKDVLPSVSDRIVLEARAREGIV